MIAKIGQCQRCMGMIYLAEEVGLRWTADLEPLDAQTAVQALMVGREVYRIGWNTQGVTLSTAKPAVLAALRTAPTDARPVVVASHPCPTGAAKVLKPVLPASNEEGGTGTPKAPAGPSGERTAPFSGPVTAPSGVTPAVKPRSETFRDAPICSGCGQPCADGTYASIALGDLIQWARHVADCGR